MVFLKISQNSRESTCTRVSFWIKLQAWGLQLYLKKRLWHMCFPVNFAKFLKTVFLQNTSGALLLTVSWEQWAINIFETTRKVCEYVFFFDPYLFILGWKIQKGKNFIFRHISRSVSLWLNKPTNHDLATICGACAIRYHLFNLKHENHPWFKPATLLKV